jgi:UDP-N-acetylmuramate: L-alanyl-gamma-D-glutamyl-meso-diaminopimelate ligase
MARATDPRNWRVKIAADAKLRQPTSKYPLRLSPTILSSMHIFIAGICGTFMAGLALIAREMGARVRGCDEHVYPPMSEQLRSSGIEVLQAYDPRHLDERPDIVIVGNALSRGNPLVEYLLDEGIPYTSGAEWLYANVLSERIVLAVAGTHGKTTTSSMLAWILTCAHDAAPGFLIGGIPGDFGISARLGASKYFVVEADEYDTAFFDKRSKFVHYRPRGLIINNIEYDHADIFPDLAAIQRQFHHLVRTVPASGLIVHPRQCKVVDEVFAMGCWSSRRSVGLDDVAGEWRASLSAADGSSFAIYNETSPIGHRVQWPHLGLHNVSNALAAAALAEWAGVPVAESVVALSSFKGVKRRLECIGEVRGIRVYDDFAHHPTAIETTLAGIRASISGGRIFAIIEPRSNTMRLGAHRQRLPASVGNADQVIWFQPPGVDWGLESVSASCDVSSSVCDSTQRIIEILAREMRSGDNAVIMSNGGFEGIHQRLLDALAD